MKFLLPLLFCCLFIGCSRHEVSIPKPSKRDAIEPVNRYSNPALINGSSFGHYLQSLYRLGIYSDMLKFTESRTVQRFGRDQLLIYFKTKLKFDYELGKLTNVYNTGDTIVLTYSKSQIDATRQLIRIKVMIENDSCKLVLHYLNDNPFCYIFFFEIPPYNDMKRVKCKSGIVGWQSKLQKNYNSFEEFEYYSGIYGVHERLGFDTAEEAWKANPLIRGSVIPSDLEVVG